MRKGSLLKVSLKVNTECIRFTSLAILIIALLPADIKGHCPLVISFSLALSLARPPPFRSRSRRRGREGGEETNSTIQTQAREQGRRERDWERVTDFGLLRLLPVTFRLRASGSMALPLEFPSPVEVAIPAAKNGVAARSQKDSPCPL